MAASRAVRPEDSISNVSGHSWSHVHQEDLEADLPPADLELPKRQSEVVIENKVTPPPQAAQTSATRADQPASSSEPQAPAPPARAEVAPKAPPPGIPPPPPVFSTSASAPATQAAQNLLAGVNLQYGSRKLRKQAERAARKGAKALRFGQLVRGEEVHLGRLDDVVRIGAVRQVGLLDRRCDEPPVVPTVQVAHHEGRQLDVG